MSIMVFFVFNLPNMKFISLKLKLKAPTVVIHQNKEMPITLSYSEVL